MKNIEKERIEKILDKAHDYSSSIIKEMHEVYGDHDQPYFLHILLNQCALGLRHYGCDEKDIFGFISDVFRLHPLQSKINSAISSADQSGEDSI